MPVTKVWDMKTPQKVGTIAALLAASAVVPVMAQEAPALLAPTYNATEMTLVAPMTRGAGPAFRLRGYNGFRLGPVEYSGFNEANLNDPSNYCGYNVLMYSRTVGAGPVRFQPGLFLASSVADTSVRFGFRNTSLVKRLGGTAGYIDASTGKNDYNITVFYAAPAGAILRIPKMRKALDKLGNLELYTSDGKAFSGESRGPFGWYSEFQLTRNIGKLCDGCGDLELFARLEMVNAGETKRYLAGIRVDPTRAVGAGARKAFRNVRRLIR
jgi:hypothetical protein